LDGQKLDHFSTIHGILPEGDNFVFLTQKGEPYLYSGFQYLMKKFSRKLKKQGDGVLADKLHFHPSGIRSLLTTQSRT
jgi:hypothetical protein